jgi:hypothetical protein
VTIDFTAYGYLDGDEGHAFELARPPPRAAGPELIIVELTPMPVRKHDEADVRQHRRLPVRRTDGIMRAMDAKICEKRAIVAWQLITELAPACAPSFQEMTMKSIMSEIIIFTMTSTSSGSRGLRRRASRSERRQALHRPRADPRPGVRGFGAAAVHRCLPGVERTAPLGRGAAGGAVSSLSGGPGCLFIFLGFRLEWDLRGVLFVSAFLS